MYLGIEIGGTKLQFGIGSDSGGPLAVIERLGVDRRRGAEGIRDAIRRVGGQLIQAHAPVAVGVGFGGPVDAHAGRTIQSFQIDGWDDFPLAAWCRETLKLPTVVGNDSDLAGLGEARFGAGRAARVVFYSNVGSGIGGSLVVDGTLYQGGGGIASELGHLRPGPEATEPAQTVESIASGWAIASAAQKAVDQSSVGPDGIDLAAADLLARCDGDLEKLTAKAVSRAYAEGNSLAQAIFRRAIDTYGWALAQMITLVAPELVVIGGGVPRLGESLYTAPLRDAVNRYVFPPLLATFRVVPAELGEEVVVHGAIALAASSRCVGPR